MDNGRTNYYIWCDIREQYVTYLSCKFGRFKKVAEAKAETGCKHVTARCLREGPDLGKRFGFEAALERQKKKRKDKREEEHKTTRGAVNYEEESC